MFKTLKIRSDSTFIYSVRPVFLLDIPLHFNGNGVQAVVFMELGKEFLEGKAATHYVQDYAFKRLHRQIVNIYRQSKDLRLQLSVVPVLRTALPSAVCICPFESKPMVPSLSQLRPRQLHFAPSGDGTADC